MHVGTCCIYQLQLTSIYIKISLSVRVQLPAATLIAQQTT